MRRELRATSTALTLLLIGIVISGLFPTAPAYALGTSIIVKTSLGDTVNTGDGCTLREALQRLFSSVADCGGAQASGLVFIVFDTPGTIKLTQGQLASINNSNIVTITGPVIIDGNNDNIFMVKDTGTLILAGLTLTKGKRAITVDSGGSLDVAGVSFLSNTQDGAGGGAIYSSGSVKIAGSLFTANTAPSGSGGAITSNGSDSLTIAGTIFTGNMAKLNGGAIVSLSKATLTDVIFNGNIGQGDDGDTESYNSGGGAVFFSNSDPKKPLTITRGVFNGNLSPMGDGGAIFANINSTVEVSDSALNGNLAGLPTKLRAGGAIYSTATMTVTHSTFLNNGVVGNGGAIANDRKGVLNISNSTLVANAAAVEPPDSASDFGRGGAIASLNSQTGSSDRPKTTLLNVTLSTNASTGGSASAGGGLYSQAPSGSFPQVTVLGNTIIAGSDGAGDNCAGGPYTSLGHNLDSGTSCGLNAAGDLKNADSKLAAPFFNGGPIPTLLTMKLKPGSKAIDAGDATICADGPVNGEDQRGTARPQDGDATPPAACDIGAYEGDALFPGFGSDPVSPGPITFGNATVGSSLPGSLSVFNTGDASLTISAGSLAGPNAADFALTTPFPLSIAPGDPAKTIGLTCAPSASGQRSASLYLSTNAPGTASVNFSLDCTGTPLPTAGFAASPPVPGPIDMGKVRVGQNNSAPLEISEVGAATLNVSGITVGGLNPGDFSLSSTANFSIANDAAAVSRSVTCAPTALGQRSATLTMQTNDPGQPSASFALSCTGTPAPQKVFEETGTPVAAAAGPYGVTLDPQGNNVYVTADTAGVIDRYLRNSGGYPTSGLGYADNSISGGSYLAGSIRSLVSPDGKFVYTAAATDDAINTYERNPSDGTLSYKESVKFGDVWTFPCISICITATIKGLNGAYAMAISPDGKYIYVSGISSNSITVLERNPDTGSLMHAKLVNSVIYLRPNLVIERVDNTNLSGAYDIAISPDGQNLYATGYNGNTLMVFKRDAANGDILPVSGGVYGTAAVPSLQGVFRVTLSPDGNFVYTSSFDSNKITAFQRDPTTGKLTPISGGVYGDGVAGHYITSAAVSPDGKYLFATEYASPGSVLVYLRDQATGELSLLQTISTADIAGARDVAVAPDGRMIFVTGHSSNKVVGFAIANPVPVLTSLDPASATAGSPQITLNIHGEGFAPGAVVTWGGANLAGTQFVSPNLVTVPIPAAKLAAAGTAVVGVYNLGPAGGNSANTLTFTITAPPVGNTPAENPVPSITAIIPNSALAGSANQLVTVKGAGFISSSKVLWNGAERPATYVDGTTLQFTVEAGDKLQPGTSGVAVRNPTPGGGLSNSVGFDVAAPGENPIPAISSITPKSVIAGSVSTELLVTISGANFMPESQARWQGTPRPTTYVSPTQLQVAISGGDLLGVATYSIDVVNPGPGGGPSNSASFQVGATGSNPVPSLSNVKLAFTASGVKVMLIGQGFIAGSKPRWGGANYTPTSVTATQIVFNLPMSAAHSGSVVVTNPAPGGGASDSLLVTIWRVNLPLIRR